MKRTKRLTRKQKARREQLKQLLVFGPLCAALLVFVSLPLAF